MFFSLVVAAVLLLVKCAGAMVTGSSAVYSDAAESVGHFLAVCFATWALWLSHKPADETHHFGHDKIAFLSAGFEGAMISAAALMVLVEAARQFIYGVEIQKLGLGMIISAVAVVVNFVLGSALMDIGKKSNSPLIRANGHHVLTDVWSSVAVLVALGLYGLTGWKWLDPVVATIAAVNILRVGWKLIRESVAGLLDESDPEMEGKIRSLLEVETRKHGLSYHNLRYRHSGRLHWMEFHLVFEDDMTVRQAHHEATAVEAALAKLVHPNGRVISHLEPKSAEHEAHKWEVF